MGKTSNVEAPVIGKDALGRPITELSVIPRWDVDRKEIEWYPKIKYNVCAGCGTASSPAGGASLTETPRRESRSWRGPTTAWSVA